MRPLLILGIIQFGALILCVNRSADAQTTPSLPPSVLNSESDNNSLGDILKTDLLNRLRKTAEEINKQSSNKTRKPRPELGQRRGVFEPVDLSEYLGPDGDQEKAWDILEKNGKVPPRSVFEPPSVPQDATSPIQDLWKDAPLEKRMNYVEDLMKRRKYYSAQNELDEILETGLKGDDLVNALVMREKALFHLKHGKTVESDYYRLKAYFPDDKRIDELKTYLEDQSGIKPLQDTVLKNPSNSQSQRLLLDQYIKHQWLDFAEEFFGVTINDTSEASIQSLSEVYYRKQDHPMLIELSRAAQNLFPHQAIYYYNEGAGLYAKGDPVSLHEAKSVFDQAFKLARQKGLQEKINWYRSHLPSTKR